MRHTNVTKPIGFDLRTKLYFNRGERLLSLNFLHFYITYETKNEAPTKDLSNFGALSGPYNYNVTQVPLC